MRCLTLVRHANAARDLPDTDDFDRPLDERGMRDAPVMAQRTQRWLTGPLRLIASPALRTRTTAGIFAEVLGIKPGEVLTHPAIYEADLRTLWQVLRELDDHDHEVILVGHNPGLTELAHSLGADEIDDLPTCAVARFELDVAAWQEAAPGCGRLMAYSFPKERQ